MNLALRLKGLFATSPFSVNWLRFGLTYGGIFFGTFAIQVWTSGFYPALVKYINFALAYGLLVVMAGMLHRALAKNRLLEQSLSMAMNSLVTAKLRISEFERSSKLVNDGAACEEMQAWANYVLLRKRDPSPDETHVDMMALDEDGRVLDMHFGGERPSKEMWERLGRGDLPMVPWDEVVKQWPFIDRSMALRDAIYQALDSAEDLHMPVSAEEMTPIANERMLYNNYALAGVDEVARIMKELAAEAA